jgi:hypothetical protein
VFGEIVDLAGERDGRSQRHGADGVQSGREAFETLGNSRAGGVEDGDHQDYQRHPRVGRYLVPMCGDE